MHPPFENVSLNSFVLNSNLPVEMVQGPHNGPIWRIQGSNPRCQLRTYVEYHRPIPVHALAAQHCRNQSKLGTSVSTGQLAASSLPRLQVRETELVGYRCPSVGPGEDITHLETILLFRRLIRSRANLDLQVLF